jgi:carboxypeptidase family protein
MTRSVSRSSTLNLFRLCAVISFLLTSSFLTTYGQTTTFAQFLERAGGQDFVFTNNTTSADLSNVVGGSPIFFLYQNLPGLDPSLQNFQNAHLTITTTTTQPGLFNGSTFSQPLNQQVTIQIIRDTPAPVGRNSRTNLLTAVFLPSGSTPAIVGASSSATLSATTPDQNVIFSSDFLLFHQTTSRNLALSFSSVTPSLALGAGSFLENFTAAGSGTFASDPLPTLPSPTAAGVSVSGRVSTSNGRALRNAEVILIEPNGTIRRTRTGSLGFFEFTDVAGGQAVIVEVRSSRHSFSSRVVSLADNASGVDFIDGQ